MAGCDCIMSSHAEKSCRDASYFWLCRVEFCHRAFITAWVLRRPYGKPHKLRFLVKDFFHRIHLAFKYVSLFWWDQVKAGTQSLSLSPMGNFIRRECSWVLGEDTSEKGAFLLRSLLRKELGYYSLSETSEKEIRDSIVRQGRSLPVFQCIIDHTPDVAVLCTS